MSFAKNDFFVAASKASRTTVVVKKEDDIDTFSFDDATSRDDLKKDLAVAEDIFKKLKGKVSKKKLTTIKERIEDLKAKIEGEKPKAPDHVLEHDGVAITAPIFEDLHDELKELDEAFDIPSREEETKEDVKELPKEEITPPEKPAGLLNLAPPPKK
ncbi:hypothetical protein HQ533_05695 [Candidatus Woesearchaeota archaeon]|nr:hypothetical protein [Candidatus Woesearchaeota archaeon]